MFNDATAARGVTRREALRLGVMGAIAAGLGAACQSAPAAPPAAQKPTSAPAPAVSAKSDSPAALATAAPAPTAAPAVAKPATATGKVVLMTGGDPPNLDAQTDSNNATRIVVFDNVIESLVTYDNDLKLTPGLATSWERMGETKTRFKLRQGVKFHNGEVFNAGAVVFAVKRMNDPANNASVLSFLDTIDKAEAVDDYTVDVITKGPDPILPRRITFLGFLAPKATEADPKSAADKPIGTGPYQVTEWTKGQRILLTAFDGYWGDAKPTIKEVEYRPRKESSVRMTALKAGEAHLIENISPEDAATLPKEQVLTKYSLECMFLRPNAKAGVTADKRVRLAMSYAIDRPSIVKQIMGGFANEPNGQLYVPSTFGYDTTMKDHPYDLEKAKALIKEAGAEGKPLTIIGNSANRWLKDREVQEALGNMIGKAGLKVDFKLIEQAEWLKAGREVQNPPMDVWFSSAGNDLVDPDRILFAYVKTGGRLSLFSNPETDKLLDASRAELDNGKREGILKQVAKIVQDEAAMLPVAQQNWIYGISPKLKFTVLANGQLPANRMTLQA
ncbi:MAG: ABC transporter substrate-binding protein [Chloroflexota bacterium]